MHYTILVHNIGNVKADLTEELGFGPVSEIMKKYLDDKDYTHHRKKNPWPQDQNQENIDKHLEKSMQQDSTKIWLGI